MSLDEKIQTLQEAGTLDSEGCFTADFEREATLTTSDEPEKNYFLSLLMAAVRSGASEVDVEIKRGLRDISFDSIFEPVDSPNPSLRSFRGEGAALVSRALLVAIQCPDVQRLEFQSGRLVKSWSPKQGWKVSELDEELLGSRLILRRKEPSKFQLDLHLAEVRALGADCLFYPLPITLNGRIHKPRFCLPPQPCQVLGVIEGPVSIAHEPAERIAGQASLGSYSAILWKVPYRHQERWVVIDGIRFYCPVEPGNTSFLIWGSFPLDLNGKLSESVTLQEAVTQAGEFGQSLFSVDDPASQPIYFPPHSWEIASLKSSLTGVTIRKIKRFPNLGPKVFYRHEIGLKGNEKALVHVTRKRTAELSPCSSYVLLSGPGIEVCSASDGKVVFDSKSDSPFDSKWLPGGELITTSFDEKSASWVLSISAFSGESIQPKRELARNEHTQALVVHPSGKSMALLSRPSRGDTMRVQTWKLPQGEPVLDQTSQVSILFAKKLSYDPYESQGGIIGVSVDASFAITYLDERVHLWSQSSTSLPTELEGSAPDLSDDGSYLALQSTKGVRILETKSYSLLTEVKAESASFVPGSHYIQIEEGEKTKFVSASKPEVKSKAGSIDSGSLAGEACFIPDGEALPNHPHLKSLKVDGGNIAYIEVPLGIPNAPLVHQSLGLGTLILKTREACYWVQERSFGRLEGDSLDVTATGVFLSRQGKSLTIRHLDGREKLLKGYLKGPWRGVTSSDDGRWVAAWNKNRLAIWDLQVGKLRYHAPRRIGQAWFARSNKLLYFVQIADWGTVRALTLKFLPIDPTRRCSQYYGILPNKASDFPEFSELLRNRPQTQQIGFLLKPDIWEILIAEGADGTLSLTVGKEAPAKKKSKATPNYDILRRQPNGPHIVGGTRKGELEIFNFEEWRLRGFFALPFGPIEAIEFSPNGQAVYVWHEMGPIAVWKVDEGRRLGTIIFEGESYFCCTPEDEFDGHFGYAASYFGLDESQRVPGLIERLLPQ